MDHVPKKRKVGEVEEGKEDDESEPEPEVQDEDIEEGGRNHHECEPQSQAVVHPVHGCRGCEISRNDVMYHSHPDDIFPRPCPLYFEEYPFYNMEFQVLNPVEICTQIQNSFGLPYRTILAALASGMDDVPFSGNTERKRKLYKSLFITFGAFERLKSMENTPNDIGMITTDYVSLTGFRYMLQRISNPFKDDDISSPLRCCMLSLLHSYLFNTYNNFYQHFMGFCNSLEIILKQSLAEGTIISRDGEEFKKSLMENKTAFQVIERCVEAMANPPAASVDPNDDLSRDAIIDFLIDFMSNKRIVLTDTEVPTRVLVALPCDDNGVFNYTYSSPMPIGEALRKLRVDKSISRIYGKQAENLSKELHTFHESSCIPYSPDDFVTRMRYIAFVNGLYCCITGIFYYHQNKRDDRLPNNWKWYSDDLEKLNGCKPRAMIYIRKEMRYYDMISFMLGGAFLRERNEEYRRKRDQSEDEFINQWSGFDTIYSSPYDESASLPQENKEQLCAEQREYILSRWENFEEWIFDKNYLKRLDTLDIRCRSPQKIFGDQQIPRNAYRRWLSCQGRCLSGVIGSQTRVGNGAQAYMEALTQNQVEDRMEFSVAMTGIAGCGKSQVLAMIQRYIMQQYVGPMSDHERPIDNFSTIRDKAVCIASDYQHDDKKPSVNPGDFKKAVSNEAIVNHRLHMVSKIIYFVCMFVFASNAVLPFKETYGDISRRIFFFPMKHKVPVDARRFAEGDDRNVLQVFDDEDVDAYAIASTWEHRRILLNVGNTSVYTPQDKDFQIPKFLLESQAEFIRGQDSLSAFLLSLQKRFGWGHANRDYSVERDRFLEMYKAYCEQHRCVMMKDTDIDQNMIRNYQVSIRAGPPSMYCKIRVDDEEEQQEDIVFAE